ncbi:hypothetical protein CKAH01_08926 [Colletotrichum kahawae]|uniref:Uncharacterized protein n=1 Tax=Colletotrichum kahawae TaxID=34407 RepID=A0AAE0D0X3_COLKA|nr:hypothetical protein CKAH01_08926 [Colletotrichum kahawae]
MASRGSSPAVCASSCVHPGSSSASSPTLLLAIGQHAMLRQSHLQSLLLAATIAASYPDVIKTIHGSTSQGDIVVAQPAPFLDHVMSPRFVNRPRYNAILPPPFPANSDGSFFYVCCLCVVVWLRPRAIITVADSLTLGPARPRTDSNRAGLFSPPYEYTYVRTAAALDSQPPTDAIFISPSLKASFQNIICLPARLGGLASHPLFATAGLPPRSQTGGQRRRAQS